MNIPKQAQKLIDIIQQHNLEAYIVGGYVRDTLLGKTTCDIDIATNGLPKDLKQIFKNYNIIETGIKHGTITIIIEKEPIEITTYRIDGKYNDQRHPNKVSFTNSLKTDLARRDFTINALAYNPQTGIIDYNNGQQDLKNKIIKTVGNPDKRFAEDGLRILRALRFASELGFSIEQQTKTSLHKNKNILNRISSERKLNELKKLLLGDNLKEIILTYSDILDILIPNIHLAKYTPSDLEQKAQSVQNIKPQLHLRLAMILQDQNPNSIHTKPNLEKTKQTLETLKLDKKNISKIITLLKHCSLPLKNTDPWIKQCLNQLGKDAFFDLLKIKKATSLAQNPIPQEQIKTIEKIENRGINIIQKGECTSLKNLNLNGNDLIEIGFCKGITIGQTLNQILDLVITNKLPNSKNALIAYAKTKLPKPH